MLILDEKFSPLSELLTKRPSSAMEGETLTSHGLISTIDTCTQVPESELSPSSQAKRRAQCGDKCEKLPLVRESFLVSMAGMDRELQEKIQLLGRKRVIARDQPAMVINNRGFLHAL